jgi:hypothetical protein
VHVESLEGQPLSPDLTLPDGSLPPPLGPLARCVRIDEGAHPLVRCGTDASPQQIELTSTLR